LHQHLRRVDRAERKHGLVASPDPMEGSGSRQPLSNGLGKASKRQSRSVLSSAGVLMVLSGVILDLGSRGVTTKDGRRQLRRRFSSGEMSYA
jgi:hypothetical protein